MSGRKIYNKIRVTKHNTSWETKLDNKRGKRKNNNNSRGRKMYNKKKNIKGKQDITSWKRKSILKAQEN